MSRSKMAGPRFLSVGMQHYEVRVVLEVSQEQSIGGMEVVLAATFLLLELDHGFQFHSEGLDGSFEGITGVRGYP